MGERWYRVGTATTNSSERQTKEAMMKHWWDYVICGSAGNDSVALVLWCWEHRDTEGIENPIIIYNETHWNRQDWPARVTAYQRMVTALGWPFRVIDSVGMRELVRIRGRGMPPQNGRAYCTEGLKILPTQDWLDSWDPMCETTLVRGIRRQESTRRLTALRDVEGKGPVDWRTKPKNKHTGLRLEQRRIFQPLVSLTECERNALIASHPELTAELPIVRRGSGECHCVNSDKAKFRQMTAADIADVRAFEASETERTGKPFHFWSPKRHQGAEGVDAVIRWAHSEHGKGVPQQSSLCDFMWCGT